MTVYDVRRAYGRGCSASIGCRLRQAQAEKDVLEAGEWFGTRYFVREVEIEPWEVKRYVVPGDLALEAGAQF